MSENSELEAVVNRVITSLEAPGPDGASFEATLRERFYELAVLTFGNLFPRMPLTGNIYDRATLQRVTQGLDDGEASNLGKRADDWLRQEGIIKQEEGKRTYYLPRATLAVLSTAAGTSLLGDVCVQILRRYVASNPSDECRAATRALGAAILRALI